jgi:putative transposase
MTAESVEAVMRRFKKAIIERALGAEMTHHLGYESGGTKPEGIIDHCNGSSGRLLPLHWRWLQC